MRSSRTLLLAMVLPAACLLSCRQAGPELLGRTLNEWNRQLDAHERLDRLAAVRAVGEIVRRDPEASGVEGVLLRAARHDDSAARYWAVRSLGELDHLSLEATESLQSALQDTTAEVRIWAAYALYKQRDTEAGLPVLLAELRGSNGAARLQATHALEALGEQSDQTVKALRGVLGDDFGYPERVATRILKNLGEVE